MRLVGVSDEVGGRLMMEMLILGFILGGTMYIYEWGGVMHFLPEGWQFFS